jgi:hypothetical protein
VQYNVFKLAKAQRPEFHNHLTTYWCFTACEQKQLLAANFDFSDPSGGVQQVAVKSLSASQRFNVVFLGKESVAKDCGATAEDQHPFGCDLLAEAAKGNTGGILGKPFRSTTGVNLREGLPIVFKTGKPKFACKIEELAAGTEVKIGGVFVLDYLGDTFYWGAVEGRSDRCPVS